MKKNVQGNDVKEYKVLHKVGKQWLAFRRVRGAVVAVALTALVGAGLTTSQVFADHTGATESTSKVDHPRDKVIVKDDQKQGTTTKQGSDSQVDKEKAQQASTVKAPVKTPKVKTGWIANTPTQIAGKISNVNAKYTINHGDTLWGITKALETKGYAVSVARLAQINSIADANLIITGDTLNFTGAGQNAVVTVKGANGQVKGTYNMNPNKPVKATAGDVAQAQRATANQAPQAQASVAQSSQAPAQASSATTAKAPVTQATQASQAPAGQATQANKATQASQAPASSSAVQASSQSGQASQATSQAQGSSVTPATPANNGGKVTPVTPSTPSTPANNGGGTTPVAPNTPNTPNKPDTPSNPDTPNTPDKPVNPVTPADDGVIHDLAKATVSADEVAVTGKDATTQQSKGTSKYYFANASLATAWANKVVGLAGTWNGATFTVTTSSKVTNEGTQAYVVNFVSKVTPVNPVTPTVNKDALQAEITTAQGAIAQAGKYTDASVTAVKNAIYNAQGVMNNKAVTQAQVDNAVTALKNAVAGLQVKPVTPTVNKATLEANINKANGLVGQTSVYTAESLQKLSNALGEAKGVDGNAKATQEQVDNASTDLVNAINGLVKKPVAPVVNKATLEGSINKANGLIGQTTVYTSDSLQKLSSALGSAKSVDNNAQATQGQVDSANTDLVNAINGLVKKPVAPVVNKATLQNLVTKAKGLVGQTSVYTSASLQKLQGALTSGENVLNDTNATQDQVDGAVTYLNSAINGLEKQPVTPTPSDPTDPSAVNGHDPNGLPLYIVAPAGTAGLLNPANFNGALASMKNYQPVQHDYTVIKSNLLFDSVATATDFAENYMNAHDFDTNQYEVFGYEISSIYDSNMQIVGHTIAWHVQKNPFVD